MDEKTIRDLLRQSVSLGTNLAALTPNLIDDKVLSVANTIVETDQYWLVAWRVIQTLIGYLDKDDQILVTSADPDTATLAEQTGIDPATIVLVIQAIMEILKWWKNR